MATVATVSDAPIMTRTSDAPVESPADEPARPAEHPASHLRAVVVEYDRRPDRCTVCPREMDPDQITTAWITADAASFYDLSEVR